MALRHSQICNISPKQLTILLNDSSRKVRLIDCRSFLEYNDNHIVGAVNICCSKLIKRRLQQEKICLKDLLVHCRIEIDETSDVIVYDQRSNTADDVTYDSFIYVLLKKLVLVFDKVYLLSGGLVNFHRSYPNLCENKIWKYPGLSTLSQPCLPTASSGPTRILSFLYLGSEDDANNKELLQSHNITYELNVSNKCPKPDFLCDGHFMRIPVNDSHNEKLMPHFTEAFQFIDKVRESNESVLVHCLAGISRSPTVAIAYIMKHLMLNCEDAYRYVKAKRATISPNFNFLGQLLEYEKQLINEGILEKPAAACSYPVSQPSEIPHGPDLPILSPPPTSMRMGAKRLNLSLRLSPLSASTGLTSPKDASPTTAMARLQFDKPQGKENRTGNGTQPSTSSSCIGATNLSLGFSLSRPTRLVKEQNVSSIQEEDVGSWNSMTKSVTKQSLSLSISKEFRSRKCTEQYQQSSSSSLNTKEEEGNNERDPECFNTKKCRVHKIIVDEEGATDKPCMLYLPKSELGATSVQGAGPSGAENVQTDLMPSPFGSKRDYIRSDSVSTSGLGSEISDHELLASGSWDMSESGVNPDDGVFSDNLSLHSRSANSSRQLQLWSSDSGHWSSTDEGVVSPCSWVPPIESLSSSSVAETKSPEKRKFSENTPGGTTSQSFGGFEKRRSYAEAVSDDAFRGESSRHKRWSLAETKMTEASDEKDENSSGGDSMSEAHRMRLNRQGLGSTKEGMGCRAQSSFSSGSSITNDNSYLHFGQQWFNMLSGSELGCCDRQRLGLYRVHSCPGIIGYEDWIQFRNNQVPESDSPPEPVSDSVLLKMRCSHNRSLNQNSFEPEHLGGRFSSGKSRFSSGNIDYDELWSKLRSVQDANKADSSSHSSSSTLASSSFSIVVQ